MVRLPFVRRLCGARLPWRRSALRRLCSLALAVAPAAAGKATPRAGERPAAADSACLGRCGRGGRCYGERAPLRRIFLVICSLSPAFPTGQLSFHTDWYRNPAAAGQLLFVSTGIFI